MGGLKGGRQLDRGGGGGYAGGAVVSRKISKPDQLASIGGEGGRTR